MDTMYEAVKSFSGRISMAKGEKRAIQDANLVRDLLQAVYIAEVKNSNRRNHAGDGKESRKN